MLDISKTVAQRGTCPRSRVGCVIEIDGRILTMGYNGSLPGDPHCDEEGCLMNEGHCIRTLHAEANAICWAAKMGISIEGANLYVTGWKDGGSCHRCSNLAWAAGIVNIVTEDENGYSSIRTRQQSGNRVPTVRA